MTYSAAQIAQVAAGAGFTGDGLAIAVAVALAESGGNPTAHAVTGREDSRGLWQINTLAHPSYDAARLYEPAYNAAAAYDISSGGTNWRAWSTYTNGAYRSHLTAASTAANTVNAASSVVPAGHLSVGATGGVPDPISVLSPAAGLLGVLGGFNPTDEVAQALTKVAEAIGPIVLSVGLEIVFTVAAFALISMGLHRLTGRGPLETFNKITGVAGPATAAVGALA